MKAPVVRQPQGKKSPSADPRAVFPMAADMARYAFRPTLA